MALIERLMGLADDGITPDPENKISVHAFFAAQSEVIAERLTLSNIKAFLEMDTACAAEYDALAATAPTGTIAKAIAEKALFIEKIHAIFILAEHGGIPGYSTPTEIRNKLGI